MPSTAESLPAPAAGVAEVQVVADSDSRWKWGAGLAQRLAPDATVHGTLLWGRSAPSEQQLQDVSARADSLRRATLAEVADRFTATTADVVVLACVGGGVQSLLHALAHRWSGRARRPVVITGYVGLVYERVVDGLLLRAGADLVLANSTADAEHFRRVYAGVGVDPRSVLRSALPYLGGAAYDPGAAGRNRPFTVTFATQPGVPETRAERSYALAEAVRHAREHPQRQVTVKLRGRVGERTTHVEPHHYSTLPPAAEHPDNLEFRYGAMAPVLDRTDLLVTVSSTAALEAMHRGIPTAVLTDFGIRESLGNQLFIGSGALMSWSGIHAGAVPDLDPGWAAANGVRDLDPYQDAAERVRELVARAPDLPPLRPYLQPGDAGGYLPALLARNGLDVAGRPIGAPAAPGLPRRAARAAARRAYDFGVRRVEPRIRRLSGL